MAAFGAVVVVLIVFSALGWRHQRSDARAMARHDATTPTTPIDLPATIPGVVISPVAVTPKAAVSWPNGRTLHVLFLGDSISHGALATTPANSYANLVTDRLREHGPTDSTIEAAPGMGVAYWLARTEVIPADTNLAVIELGTNDINDTNAYKVALAKFDSDYQALEQAIAEHAPSAEVVCISAWGHSKVPTTHLYNQTITDDCAGKFVDVQQLSDDPANLAGDNFHPNDAGHRAIATAVMRAISFHS